MYILILVTTLLMLLGIIGTTRFELFLGSMGIRTSYEKYMQEDERRFYNKTELAKYDKPPPKTITPGAPPAPPDDDDQKTKSPKPVGKLNIGPLVYDPTVTKFTKEYTEVVTKTFIRLIENIYGSQKFFVGVSPEDFVNVFMQETKKKICGKTIKNVEQLAGLTFQNPRMREIFYEMIRDKDRGPGQDQLPPLLSLLTLRQAPVAIRVFLAPRPLLLAIYNSPAIVNQVIEYRNHPLGSIVITPEGMEASATAEAEETDAQLAPPDKTGFQSASELFKNQGFNANRYQEIPDSFLDFTVSAATPPK